MASEQDFPDLPTPSVSPFYDGYTSSYTAFPIDEYLNITISDEPYTKYSNGFTLIDMIILFIHIQKEKEHDYGKAIIRVIGKSASTEQKSQAKEFVPIMIYWHSLYLLYHFFRTPTTPSTPIDYSISLSVLESKSTELMTNFDFFVNNIKTTEKPAPPSSSSSSSSSSPDNMTDVESSANKLNKTHSIKLFNLAKDILTIICKQQKIILKKNKKKPSKNFIRTITGLSDLCRDNEKELATFIQGKCDIDSTNTGLEGQVNNPDKFFSLVRPEDFKPKYYFNNSGIATSFLPDWNEKNKQTNCQFIDPGNTASAAGPYYKTQNETVGSINMITTYNPGNNVLQTQSHAGKFIRNIKINKLNIGISFDIPVYYEQKDQLNTQYLEMNYNSPEKNPIELTNVYNELASYMEGIQKKNIKSLTLNNIKKMIEITEKKVSGDFGFITQSLLGDQLTPSMIANNDDTIGYLIKILYLFMNIDFEDLLNYEESLKNGNKHTSNECPDRITPYICSALSDRTDKTLAFSRPYSFVIVNPELLKELLELQKEDRRKSEIIKDLEDKLDRMINNDKINQDKIEKMEEQIKKVNNQNIEYVKSIQELKKTVSSLQQDKDNMQTHINTLNKQINNYIIQNSKFESEVNKAKKIYESIDHVLDTYENHLEDIDNLIKYAINNADTEYTAEKLSELQNEINELKNQQICCKCNSDDDDDDDDEENESDEEEEEEEEDDDIDGDNPPTAAATPTTPTTAATPTTPTTPADSEDSDISVDDQESENDEDMKAKNEGSPTGTPIPLNTINNEGVVTLNDGPYNREEIQIDPLNEFRPNKRQRTGNGKKKKSLKKEKKNKNKKKEKEKKQYTNKKYKSSKIKLKNVSIKKNKNRKPLSI